MKPPVLARWQHLRQHGIEKITIARRLRPFPWGVQMHTHSAESLIIIYNLPIAPHVASSSTSSRPSSRSFNSNTNSFEFNTPLTVSISANLLPNCFCKSSTAQPHPPVTPLSTVVHESWPSILQVMCCSFSLATPRLQYSGMIPKNNQIFFSWNVHRTTHGRNQLSCWGALLLRLTCNIFSLLSQPIYVKKLFYIHSISTRISTVLICITTYTSILVTVIPNRLQPYCDSPVPYDIWFPGRRADVEATPAPKALLLIGTSSLSNQHTSPVPESEETETSSSANFVQSISVCWCIATGFRTGSVPWLPVSL